MSRDRKKRPARVFIPLIVVGIWALLALGTFAHVTLRDQEAEIEPLELDVPIHEQLGPSRTSDENIRELDFPFEIEAAAEYELQLILHSGEGEGEITLQLIRRDQTGDVIEASATAESNCSEGTKSCSTARAALRRELAIGRYVLRVTTDATSTRRIPFTLSARRI